MVQSLTLGVPVVVTVGPGHITAEGGKHVEEAVGYQHVVVDAGDEADGKHAPPNTCSTHTDNTHTERKPQWHCAGVRTHVSSL